MVVLMPRYLIAYASREGQTEKIAHHIAHRLENDGALVRLIDLKAHETEAGADDCGDVPGAATAAAGCDSNRRSWTNAAWAMGPCG